MNSISIRLLWPQPAQGVAQWPCECLFPPLQEGLAVEQVLLPLADALGRAATSPQLPVVLLLPGELALHDRVQLPARGQRQAMQALPFVVEEWLADDVEKVHIAVGARQADGQWPVLVLDLVLMASLFDLATDAGVTLRAFHVDAQVLPATEGQLTVVMSGERVLVSGGHKVAAFDLETAIPMIHLLAGDAAFAHLHIRHEPDHEQQALLAQQLETEYSALGNTVVQREVADSSLTQWLTSRVPASAINLLQGRFAVRQADGGLPWWRVAAAVALFGWLGQFGLQVSSGWYFNHGAAQLERLAEDQYRKLFPDAKQVSSPRKRLESRLAAGSESSGAVAFAWLFGTSVQALQSLPNREGLSIEQLRFEGKSGELEVELKAKSIDQLDQYKQALGKLGLSGRISSANDADGAISGRMQIAKGN